MRAGILRHRVELQRRVNAPRNDYQEQPDRWSTYATVMASVDPLSGREFIAAQQVQSEINRKVTIRYYPGVNELDRVFWRDQAINKDRFFDIKYVIDKDEKHREMQLMCVEHG